MLKGFGTIVHQPGRAGVFYTTGTGGARGGLLRPWEGNE